MDSLHQLVAEKRGEIADRWLEAVKRTFSPPLATAELKNRIPSFIDELAAALHPSAVPLPPDSQSAREHGVQRLRLGFNISEVVREYGLLMKCILEVAAQHQLVMKTNELIILNHAVTAGIAEAASEYVSLRDEELSHRSDEHIGFLAHELRNPLTSARMSFTFLREQEQLSGRAADVLERSLVRLNHLLDNELTSAWLKLGAEVRKQRVDVGQALAELIEDSALEAEWRHIHLALKLDGHMELEADARLLRSAVSNALRNAIKFSREGSTVVVRASTQAGRVRIDVEDECGGLPQGKAEELMHPLVQRGHDRSGFGLGLAIARHATEAQKGSITIEDRPGIGCVVRFDLPAATSTTASSG